VREWHLLPGYLDAMVERVREGLARFPESERDDVAVIFTAHSLPQRILEWGDPYPTQLAATAAALAQRLGLRTHRFAYQSAAMTPEPWLGPDAGDVIRELGAAHRNMLIAPIGFTSEHVEILYDVDIEFRRQAEARGVRLERIHVVGTHPAMMAGLAGLVRDAAHAKGWL
jgi:ferrochelatase